MANQLADLVARLVRTPWPASVADRADLFDALGWVESCLDIGSGPPTFGVVEPGVPGIRGTWQAGEGFLERVTLTASGPDAAGVRDALTERLGAPATPGAWRAEGHRITAEDAGASVSVSCSAAIPPGP